MKAHTFKKLVALCLALLTLAVVGGCQTAPKPPPTVEAAKYYNLRDTWNTTLAIYKGYAELAVQGKVSQRDQQDIDRAWNAFRYAMKFALNSAQNDWSAIAPDEVDRLRNDLITLIRSL